MADLTLVLPADSARFDAPRTTRAHRKATIVGVDGTLFQFPIADPTKDLSGFGNRWATIDRPYAKPLTVNGGRKLHKMTIRVTLTKEHMFGGHPQISCESMIDELLALEDLSPVVVVFGGHTTAPRSTATGRWLITDMSVNIKRLVEGTNDASLADVTIELLEANLPPSTVTKPSPRTPSVRTITIQSEPASQALMQAAQREYGSQKKWRTILDANGYRDIRDVAVGDVLVLP